MPDSISSDEQKYHESVIRQKQAIDTIYSHWLLYLKEKYKLSTTAGIDINGKIFDTNSSNSSTA